MFYILLLGHYKNTDISQVVYGVKVFMEYFDILDAKKRSPYIWGKYLSNKRIKSWH
jgi:hypothetical protein